MLKLVFWQQRAVAILAHVKNTEFCLSFEMFHSLVSLNLPMHFPGPGLLAAAAPFSCHPLVATCCRHSLTSQLTQSLVPLEPDPQAIGRLIPASGKVLSIYFSFSMETGSHAKSLSRGRCKPPNSQWTPCTACLALGRASGGKGSGLGGQVEATAPQ